MEEIAKIKEQVDKTLEYVAKLDTEITMETWEKLDKFYRRLEIVNNFFRRVEDVNNWLARYGDLLSPDNVKKVAEGIRLLEPIMRNTLELED